MARPARVDRSPATAERIAARRTRTAPRAEAAGRRTPPRGVRPSGGRRALKLAVLVACCCLVGFFAVLVVDVGAAVMGRLDVGGGSFGQLVDKVVDRVLDRDVPRAREVERPRAAPPKAPSSSRAARAPLPAARPEDDARHVEVHADPQVERAKERLDEILRRL